MRDLTELKRREEEAASQRAHLRAILEGIADGVNIVAPDARLVLANQGFMRIYGFPAQLAAPGTPIADFVRERIRRAEFYPHEDPCRAEEELIVTRVAQIMTAPVGRFEETRPDGRTVEVRRERLADGTLVNTYIDITARKEAERARRASRDALRRNERLSAIASLLAGVAHEINNPLAVVAAQSCCWPRRPRARRWPSAPRRCGWPPSVAGASSPACWPARRQKPPRREPGGPGTRGGDRARPDGGTAQGGGHRAVAGPRARPAGGARRCRPDRAPRRQSGGQCARGAGGLGSAPEEPRITVELMRQGAQAVLGSPTTGPASPKACGSASSTLLQHQAGWGGHGRRPRALPHHRQGARGSIAVEETPGGGATVVVRLPLPGGG
jgi:hypothetical protein